MIPDHIHTSKQKTLRAAFQSGFTIVELLIVIVVIAILAAISIVAYRGIQQRANNTAIISAAGQTVKAIQAHMIVSGSYPSASYACITTDTGCMWDGDPIAPNVTNNTAFMNEVGITATLPRQTPGLNQTTYGMFYAYENTSPQNVPLTVDGVPNPARLIYLLFGTNQNCGVSGVLTDTYPNYTLSTTGYSNGNYRGWGYTSCIIRIKPPSN